MRSAGWELMMSERRIQPGVVTPARTHNACMMYSPREPRAVWEEGVGMTRGDRTCSAIVQTSPLQCAQEIEVVHEHRVLAGMAQNMKRLRIVPIEKGAIQITPGVGMPEDRVKRMEENICGFVAVATRLHPEVVRVPPYVCED